MTAALVLAQMMDRGDMNDGGGHWWGWLIGLGALALVIVLVVWVVTRLTQPHSAAPAVTRDLSRPSAEDLLADRLARGEIDEDEYRRRRDASAAESGTAPPMATCPSRRQFLGVLGGALAVGVVASLGDSFAVAIPSATIPRGGAMFTQPDVLASTSGRLDVTLVAAPSKVAFGAGKRFAYTYNGSTPGPTLRVRPGDVLSITLVNRSWRDHQSAYAWSACLAVGAGRQRVRLDPRRRPPHLRV